MFPGCTNVPGELPANRLKLSKSKACAEATKTLVRKEVHTLRLDRYGVLQSDFAIWVAASGGRVCVDAEAALAQAVWGRAVERVYSLKREESARLRIRVAQIGNRGDIAGRRSPTKRLWIGQAASPSSWKTPFIATRMAL